MITTAHVLRNRRALFIRDVDSPPVTQLTPGAPSRTAPSSVGHPRPGRLRRPLRRQRQCARTRPPAAPYEGEAHCEQRNYALPYRCVYGTARVGARPVPSGARQNPPPPAPRSAAGRASSSQPARIGPAWLFSLGPGTARSQQGSARTARSRETPAPGRQPGDLPTSSPAAPRLRTPARRGPSAPSRCPDAPRPSPSPQAARSRGSP